jgi:hypothetical protein
VNITMEPGWQERVYVFTDQLFLTRLGPEIFTSARAYCPVFGGQNSTATAASIAAAGPDYEPGALRDSIEFHLAGHSLRVGASGSADREYALFVELGHRIVAWGHDTGRSKGPQSFLRAALYQQRAA